MQRDLEEARAEVNSLKRRHEAHLDRVRVYTTRRFERDAVRAYVSRS